MASDVATGGGADLRDTAADALLAHLYQGEPTAFGRAFTAPDLWLRLPGHVMTG